MARATGRVCNARTLSGRVQRSVRSGMSATHSTVSIGVSGLKCAAASIEAPGPWREARGEAVSARRPALVTGEGSKPWTADRLRTFVRSTFPGERSIVLANREPMMHEQSQEDRRDRRASAFERCRDGAGALTLACGGVSVAHGSGLADRDVVDTRDGIELSRDGSSYRLRRVWLSRAEEQGSTTASPTARCGHCAISPTSVACCVWRTWSTTVE